MPGRLPLPCRNGRDTVWLMRVKVALLLAGAIVLSAAILGYSFYATRVNRETITVVGAATERFSADTVKWRLSVTKTVAAGELSSAYAGMRLDYDRLEQVFLSSGLAEEEISAQPVSSHPIHSAQGEINTYRMIQPVQVISRKLDIVEDLALDPGSFLSGEMILEQSRLEYFYSEIDTLKHQLLGAATKDARRRAEEIAQPAGVTVGTISEARAGVFQIREPFSTEVSGYGMYDTSSREKEISVTLHATFRAE